MNKIGFLPPSKSCPNIEKNIKGPITERCGNLMGEVLNLTAKNTVSIDMISSPERKSSIRQMLNALSRTLTLHRLISSNALPISKSHRSTSMTLSIVMSMFSTFYRWTHAGRWEMLVSIKLRCNRITDASFEDLAQNWRQTFNPVVFLSALKIWGHLGPPLVLRDAACVQRILEKICKRWWYNRDRKRVRLRWSHYGLADLNGSIWTGIAATGLIWKLAIAVVGKGWRGIKRWLSDGNNIVKYAATTLAKWKGRMRHFPSQCTPVNIRCGWGHLTWRKHCIVFCCPSRE